MASSGCPYLDSGAVVELEEPGWVVIDINHFNSHFCVLMQWGLPTVCGSDPQGVTGGLWQDARWRISDKAPGVCPTPMAPS